MLKYGFLIYTILLLLSLNLVNAATIHGTIYDLSLKNVDNARVEINTSPKQFLVARNGTYSFNVPNGIYAIKVQLIQKNTVMASVQENITIKQDGTYVLDLILFPDIEEGVEDIDIDFNDNLIESKNNKSNILVGTIILLVFGFILIGFYHFRIRKKQHKGQIKRDEKESQEEVENEDIDLGLIIKIIKQEGGRTTQKEIRKQIPLSEAKISLMVSELEHKGVIEKIKRGRGNILLLKKK